MARRRRSRVPTHTAFYKQMSQKNLKAHMKNREAWRRFKQAAGINRRLTLQRAYAVLEVTPFTWKKLINGFTDTKLSTMLSVCDTLGCTLQGFADAMVEAWEIAERRAKTEQAIREATVLGALDRSGDEE
jgi:hypothetical protein